MSARVGWPLAAVAVVLVFLVIGIVLDAVVPAPSGPALSSQATASDGVAAWAELLAKAGHPVSQLRGPLTGAHLPRQATLVVLASSPLAPPTPAGRATALQFLNSGGRLVLFGVRLSVPPSLRGRVVQLDDPAFLENRSLAGGDNAQRALALAGPAASPVVFDEAIHGYGASTGLAALPERWWMALGGLALALAGWALSCAWRLGGADPIVPPTPSARAAYVDALAVAVGSARDTGRLRELVQEGRLRERRLARELR